MISEEFLLQFDSLNELLKPLVLSLYLACERKAKNNKGSQPDSRGQSNSLPKESGLTTIRR
jgi:hypothetical protein